MIKYFDLFMAHKTKHNRKKRFCRYYLQYLYSSRVLERHVKNGLAINHTKLVLLPEQNEYVNFQNFKRLAKALLIKNCNFE